MPRLWVNRGGNMTTIRDLLLDFQDETIKIAQRHLAGDTTVDQYDEQQKDLREEYIQTIKERIVG